MVMGGGCSSSKSSPPMLGSTGAHDANRPEKPQEPSGLYVQSPSWSQLPAPLTPHCHPPPTSGSFPQIPFPLWNPPTQGTFTLQEMSPASAWHARLFLTWPPLGPCHTGPIFPTPGPLLTLRLSPKCHLPPSLQVQITAVVRGPNRKTLSPKRRPAPLPPSLLFPLCLCVCLSAHWPSPSGYTFLGHFHIWLWAGVLSPLH